MVETPEMCPFCHETFEGRKELLIHTASSHPGRRYDIYTIDELAEATVVHANGPAAQLDLFWVQNKDQADALLLGAKEQWDAEEKELAEAAQRYSREERLGARKRVDVRLAKEAAEQKQDAENAPKSLISNSNRQELAWETASAILARDRFATLNGSEEVRVYKDGYYAPEGEIYVKKRAQELVDHADLTNHLVEEILGHVRRESYVEQKLFSESTPLLVIQNGVFDTSTGNLKPHGPEIYALCRLPVAFLPGQDCPTFKRFLSSVLYAEDIPVVQEWFGYCLYRGYPAQKAMLFIGEGGNGKSTLISALKALLGSENVSTVSLQELEINRFAKADLFGKLANLYADLPAKALASTGTFKMLTGGDPVRAEEKFRSSFTFTNFAKLTFSCNIAPATTEDTAAFFRRWILIQFPHSFEGDCPACQTAHGVDRNLPAKLATPEELSGILNWALEGLARLRANGWQFSNSRSTEEIRIDYTRKSAPIKAFVLDCTAFQADGVVPKKGLFEAFVKYCNKMKLAAVTSGTFYKNLPLYFADNPLQVSREEINGNREWCFRGIVVRPEAEWCTPVSEGQANKPEPTPAQGETPAPKLCPRCLSPLKELNRVMTGWIPMDYYCTKCGYSGSVFVEKDRDSESEERR